MGLIMIQRTLGPAMLFLSLISLPVLAAPALDQYEAVRKVFHLSDDPFDSYSPIQKLLNQIDGKWVSLNMDEGLPTADEFDQRCAVRGITFYRNTSLSFRAVSPSKNSKQGLASNFIALGHHSFSKTTSVAALLKPFTKEQVSADAELMLELLTGNLNRTLIFRPSPDVLVFVDHNGGLQLWTRCEQQDITAALAQYQRALTLFEGGILREHRETRVARIVSKLDGQWISALTWFKGGKPDAKILPKVCKDLSVRIATVTPLAFQIAGIPAPLRKGTRAGVRYHAIGGHMFVQMLDERSQNALADARLKRAPILEPKFVDASARAVARFFGVRVLFRPSPDILIIVPETGPNETWIRCKINKN